MFIFINGKLVIDLGGVHQRLPGQVDVGADRHGDNHRGRFARHHEHDHPPVPVARSVHGPDANNMANVDGNGHSNCTNTTCDCRTRAPSTWACRWAGPTRSRSSAPIATHRVELPADAERVPDQPVAAWPAAATASAPAPRSATAATTTTRRRIRRAPVKNNDGVYGGCTPSASAVPTAATAWSTAAGEECDLGSQEEHSELRRPGRLHARLQVPPLLRRRASSTPPRVSSAIAVTINGAGGLAVSGGLSDSSCRSGGDQKKKKKKKKKKGKGKGDQSPIALLFFGPFLVLLGWGNQVGLLRRRAARREAIGVELEHDATAILRRHRLDLDLVVALPLGRAVRKHVAAVGGRGQLRRDLVEPLLERLRVVGQERAATSLARSAPRGGPSRRRR